VPVHLRPAARGAMKRKAAREAKLRLYEARARALHPSVQRPLPPLWPACVERRFWEGCDGLHRDRKATALLAESRGWPVEWVDELSGSGLMSYPALPWSQTRGVAFAVTAPDVDARGCMRLRTVGYHQRFFVPGRDGAPGHKSWIYVPWVPEEKADRELRGYMAELAVVAQERGCERGTAMVPALPFVLGSLTTANMVGVVEGEWDAVTFFGACGGFLDCYDGRLAVFGIRGASGTDALLGYYQTWLTMTAPMVLVLADNDKAGRAWIGDNKANAGQPRPVTFAEQLKRAGCSKVVLGVLRADAGLGKDFNDYFKTARPSPQDMAAWLNTVFTGDPSQ